LPDYKVKWTETSIRSLEKMERADSSRILEKMDSVSRNPFRFIKHLRGVPLYSLRAGKYRIIMSIERENLLNLVVDVGKRKNIYNDL
jgi:mRNA interferase RelE/StbE